MLIKLNGKMKMSERQIEKRDRDRDRVMSDRKTKWSLKVYFLVVS